MNKTAANSKSHRLNSTSVMRWPCQIPDQRRLFAKSRAEDICKFLSTKRSGRQVDICIGLADGKPLKELAHDFGISESTCRSHANRAKTALKLSSLGDLAHKLTVVVVLMSMGSALPKTIGYKHSGER